MSTIELILSAIIAALKFPSELGAFIKLVSQSPEEKRQEILAQVNAWMDESASGDRPKWND